MSKLIRTTCFAAVGLVCATTLSAQNVTIDTAPALPLIASTTTSAVSIDPSTGAVVVRTQNNVTSCSSTPPQITNFVTSAPQVQAGQNFTISWLSQGTTSCSPVAGTGGATGWANLGQLSTAGTTAPLTVPANATPGSVISFGLSCTNGTQTVNQNTSLIVASAVQITFFGASQGTVAPGGTFTMNWSSTGATSCSPQAGTGGTTGWTGLGTLGTSGPSANLTVPANATPGSQISFGLTCTNGTQTTPASQASITVGNGGGGPGGCPTPGAPYNVNPIDEQWVSIWGSFPNFGNWRALGPSAGQMFVIAFSAGPNGSVGTIEAFDRSGIGASMRSISSCRGDFRQELVALGCRLPQPESLGGVSYQVGGSPISGRCFLNPSQTYYFNYTYGTSNVNVPGQPYCAEFPAGACVRDIVVTPALLNQPE